MALPLVALCRRFSSLFLCLLPADMPFFDNVSIKSGKWVETFLTALQKSLDFTTRDNKGLSKDPEVRIKRPKIHMGGEKGRLMECKKIINEKYKHILYDYKIQKSLTKIMIKINLS